MIYINTSDWMPPSSWRKASDKGNGRNKKKNRRPRYYGKH